MINQNISFEANIRFVSNNEFEKVVKRVNSCKVGKNFDYLEITRGNNLHTEGIDVCTAGGVTDGQTATMFHICPITDHYDGFNGIGWAARTFENQIEKFTNSMNKKTLSGFIFGGRSQKYAPNRAGLSLQVFDKIHNYLQQLVPYISYFKGQKNSISKICYSSDNDSWYINQAFETPKKLKAEFEDIYIAPEDNLFLNNKKVERSDYPDFFVKH